MAFLTFDDLTPFADIDLDKAMAMIADATAIAVLVAPCLANEEGLDAAQMAAVKAILRGAILRWNDAGTGGIVQQTAGPFSQTVDSRSDRRAMFAPAEIEQLEAICESVNGGSTGVFAIDTAPSSTITESLLPWASGQHLDWS